MKIITHAPELGPQKVSMRPPQEKIVLTEPTILEMATNFTNAMANWAKVGFEVVDESLYEERSSICDQCEHWDGKARFGLGKCNVKGCGCTSMKRWLSTEKCPLAKW